MEATIDPFALVAETGVGTIAVSVYRCPPGRDRTTLVGGFCDAGEPTAAALLGLGGVSARGAASAGNVAEWSGLAVGPFTISTSGVGEGFIVGYTSDAVEIALGQSQVTVTVELPAFETAIYRVQPGAAVAVDTDGYGLAYGAETQVVTNPVNLDIDGDRRSDGDKVGPRIVNIIPWPPSRMAPASTLALSSWP